MCIARSFSWKPASCASLLAKAFASLSRLRVMPTGFAWSTATPLRPQSVKRVTLAVSVTPSLHIRVQESPHLPRADEPSPGILGLSVCRILTYISLLTPAFSLLYSPPLLTVRLLPVYNAPLPIIRFRSFGIRLSPGTFSAQGHSTSELLRTL